VTQVEHELAVGIHAHDGDVLDVLVAQRAELFAAARATAGEPQRVRPEERVADEAHVGRRARRNPCRAIRSTVGATELSGSAITREHRTWLNRAECASHDAVRSISHPGGRRFESG
jgi:hypothetical protein